jgi:tetratricopeptide (TPR) repeat protein
MRRRLTVLILVVGGWSLGWAADAAADFTQDSNTCFLKGPPLAQRLQACDRLIATKGLKGLDLVYVNRGTALADANRHDDAIADFSRALRINSKSAIGYIGRGKSRLAKQGYEQAVADFSAALALEPDNLAGYFGRGLSLFGAKQYKQATADLDQVIRLAPSLQAAYTTRGQSRHADGDYAGAIADYDTAIRLNSKDATAYVGRGISRYASKDYDRAIADFDGAIRLQPQNAESYRNRALAWQAKNDHARAVADFNRAIEQGAADVLSYTGRGRSRNEGRDFAGAIADFDGALAMTPDFAPALLGRAAAYEGAGDPAKARSDYLAMLAVDTGEDIEALRAKAQERLAALGPLQGQGLTQTGRRVALIVGNGAYRNVPPLPGPARDAALIATSLRRVGFQTVTLVNDLGLEPLVAALRAFAAEAATADWAVIYFSGHGLEIDGRNVLIPIDARLESDRDVELETVSLQQLLQAVEGARKLRLVLLDASRDNPFPDRMKVSVATRSIGRGLSRVEPELSTLIVYAAKHGQVSVEGDGNNNPFARSLSKWIETPNVEIRKLFDLVRDDVMEATGQRQQPIRYGSISGRDDFYFATGDSVVKNPAHPAANAQ